MAGYVPVMAGIGPRCKQKMKARGHEAEPKKFNASAWLGLFSRQARLFESRAGRDILKAHSPWKRCPVPQSKGKIRIHLQGNSP
jgi:hypothetical protein